MLRVVKQWSVAVHHAGDNVIPTMFFINDDHFSNVLRKLAEIQWATDPLMIQIAAVSSHNQEGFPQP